MSNPPRNKDIPKNSSQDQLQKRQDALQQDLFNTIAQMTPDQAYNFMTSQPEIMTLAYEENSRWNLEKAANTMRIRTASNAPLISSPLNPALSTTNINPLQLSAPAFQTLSQISPQISPIPTSTTISPPPSVGLLHGSLSTSPVTSPPGVKPLSSWQMGQTGTDPIMRPESQTSFRPGSPDDVKYSVTIPRIPSPLQLPSFSAPEREYASLANAVQQAMGSMQPSQDYTALANVVNHAIGLVPFASTPRNMESDHVSDSHSELVLSEVGTSSAEAKPRRRRATTTEERQTQRKLINREAAKRQRLKKRAKEEEMTRLHEQLKAENDAMKMIIANLTAGKSLEEVMSAITLPVQQDGQQDGQSGGQSGGFSGTSTPKSGSQV